MEKRMLAHHPGHLVVLREALVSPLHLHPVLSIPHVGRGDEILLHDALAVEARGDALLARRTQGVGVGGLQPRGVLPFVAGGARLGSDELGRALRRRRRVGLSIARTQPDGERQRRDDQQDRKPLHGG